MIDFQNLQDVITYAKDIELDLERYSDLQRVQDHYIGGKQALSNKYFSAPSRETEALFNQERKSLTHINLVRPVVRTWQSILSGSEITRFVDTPNKATVAGFVDSFDYQDMQAKWVENTLLYGTSVAVPFYNEEEDEVKVWLPNPLVTVIITNPVDVYDTIAVLEINNGYTQGITKYGDFILYEDGQLVANEAYYSYLPVAIAYGIDRRHNKEIYGLGLCDSAVDMSIRLTSVAFNITLMQKSQTRSLFTLIGDLNKLLHYDGNSPVQPGFHADGKVILPEGFDVSFLTPDPKIKESVDVQKMFSDLLACTSGIPADIISTTGIQSNSAEAAKIRALSLVQQAKLLVPAWVNYEKQLILAIAYVVEYAKAKGNYIKRKDIKERSTIEIKNQSRITPISDNEDAQTNIALVASGLKRMKDAIKDINDFLTEEEIEEMVQEYKENLKQDDAKAIADNAFKVSKEALTDQQKAEFENKE